MGDFHWWTLKVLVGLVEWRLTKLKQRQILLTQRQIDTERSIGEAKEHLGKLKTLLWNEIVAK